MANKYVWGENPIKDFLVKSLIQGIDISKKQNVKEIEELFVSFYENFLPNENDVVYLDFQIKNDKFDNFKIVANNIITALWLNGIIPNDTDGVLKANKIVYDDTKYTYNKKTKELKIEKIK